MRRTSMSWYISMMAPPVLTDARKFALTATYTAAAQTDILLATEKQYVSTQRNDRSRLSRNPRSRDEDCDRQYGEEELVQPGDDGPAFGGDDPSRQGREPVGGSALRRRGRLHGRSRHAEVLRAEGDRKAASRGQHRSVRTRESLPQTASHCSAGHLLHCWHRNCSRGRHHHCGAYGAFLPGGIEAWHRALGRCPLPISDARRLGRCYVPSLSLRRVQCGEGLQDRAGARSCPLGKTGRPRDGGGTTHRQECPARHTDHKAGRPQVYRSW